MGGVILLVSLVTLTVSIAAASKFREIAELKGHDGSPYFWYCFLLSMVIALPDLHARPSAQPAAPANSNKPSEVVSDELPDL